MGPLILNATFLYLLKISYIFRVYRKLILDANGLSKIQNFVSPNLGFSMLKRNLRENCLFFKKKMLNSILKKKINMSVLWKVLNNATETIIIGPLKNSMHRKTGDGTHYL